MQFLFLVCPARLLVRLFAQRIKPIENPSTKRLVFNGVN